MIFVLYRLLPNSWHTFSPDAGICSPMGTRVSVFRGKKIKKNSSKELKQHSLPTPKTPNNVTLPKFNMIFRQEAQWEAQELISSSILVFLGSRSGEFALFPVSGFSSQRSLRSLLWGIPFVLTTSALCRLLPWPGVFAWFWFSFSFT